MSHLVDEEKKSPEKKEKNLNEQNKNYKRDATVSAVLIGSSASAGGAVIPRQKADKSAKGNLYGTISDVAQMYKMLMKTSAVYVGKIFGDTDPKTTTRKTVLESIKYCFDDTKRTGFILYYSGHGQSKTGNWCFERIEKADQVLNSEQKTQEIKYYKITEFVSLDDILILWQKRKQRQNGDSDKQWLLIISDACFSGVWVRALEKLKAKNVQMQASCGSDETCVDSIDGGIFTNEFLDGMICYGPTLKNLKKNTAQKVTLGTGIIGLAAGAAVGLLSPIVSSPYHAWTKTFEPCFYNFQGESVSCKFEDVDEQYEYWFAFGASFTEMWKMKCVSAGAKVGSLGSLGSLGA